MAEQIQKTVSHRHTASRERAAQDEAQYEQTRREDAARSIKFDELQDGVELTLLSIDNTLSTQA